MTPLRLIQDILALLEEVVPIVIGVGGARITPLFLPLPTEVPPWSIFLAFATSAAVGIFSGVYPARRAASLDPIAALHHH